MIPVTPVTPVTPVIIATGQPKYLQIPTKCTQQHAWSISSVPLSPSVFNSITLPNTVLPISSVTLRTWDYWVPLSITTSLDSETTTASLKMPQNREFSECNENILQNLTVDQATAPSTSATGSINKKPRYPSTDTQTDADQASPSERQRKDGTASATQTQRQKRVRDLYNQFRSRYNIELPGATICQSVHFPRVPDFQRLRPSAQGLRRLRMSI